jgi:hypothetical protein
LTEQGDTNVNVIYIHTAHRPLSWVFFSLSWGLFGGFQSGCSSLLRSREFKEFLGRLRVARDRGAYHVRWVIAALASVAVGHAAMDAAIANYPDHRFTLRNGIHVIRQHPRT